MEKYLRTYVQRWAGGLLDNAATTFPWKRYIKADLPQRHTGGFGRGNYGFRIDERVVDDTRSGRSLISSTALQKRLSLSHQYNFLEHHSQGIIRQGAKISTSARLSIMR